MSSINSNPNLQIHKAAITWTIDNFPSLEAEENDVKSDEFSADTFIEIAWYSTLKPNSENEAISLFLHPKMKINYQFAEYLESVYATFNAHILTNKGEKTISKKTQVHQYVKKKYLDVDEYEFKLFIWGWKKFWTKDKNFRTNLLSNNALTICIEVVFSTTRSVLINNCDKILLRSNTTYNCNLSENLASLLETRALSDVVLCTNGKDFPAHKAILVARSKVFAAMFQHDTKENQINRIDVKDLSEETVAEMLRFIYTGKCEKLDELAEELLAAADKYDLDLLKIICGKPLYESLTVDNASRVLVLADTFNAKELKNDVIEFIVSNAFHVMGTTGWKNILSKPDLVDEVCQALSLQLICQQSEQGP